MQRDIFHKLQTFHRHIRIIIFRLDACYEIKNISNNDARKKNTAERPTTPYSPRRYPAN